MARNHYIHTTTLTAPHPQQVGEFQDFEVVVEFDRDEWEELRPYGSTVAYESMSEVVDTSFVYRLDEEPTTVEALRAKFGDDTVDKLNDEAEEFGTYHETNDHD